MRYFAGLSVIVVLLSLPARGQTQVTPGIPVYDVANHIVNTITSLESYITAVQAVLLVADSITNLTGGGTVTTGNEYLDDIALLVSLVSQAEGLSYDIKNLEAQFSALFSLDGAPDSTRALRERLAEIRRIRSQGYFYALRVQTLIQTATRIAARIVRIVETLAEIFGNLSGHENTSDQIAQLNQLQLIHNTTVQAFERAETVSKAEEALVEESVQRINEQILQDWPRRQTR